MNEIINQYSKYIPGTFFPITLKNRFYCKVLTPDENGCMEWMGALNKGGYGAFLENGRIRTASRFSYELHFGKIPKNMFVCHTCDNRRCVSPEHLFLGTHKDNMKDKKQKHRLSPVNFQLNPKSKLTNEDVKLIKLLLKHQCSQRKIAYLFNVDPVTISHINCGRTWGEIK